MCFSRVVCSLGRVLAELDVEAHGHEVLEVVCERIHPFLEAALVEQVGLVKEIFFHFALDFVVPRVPGQPRRRLHFNFSDLGHCSLQ
jgi:hypothetical protein